MWLVGGSRQTAWPHRLEIGYSVRYLRMMHGLRHPDVSTQVPITVAQPKLSLWEEGSIASTGGLVTKIQEETLTAVAADSPVYTVQLSAVPPHTTTNTVFP